MLYLGIITIDILQGMAISGEWPLLEPVNYNTYSIPTKPDSGSSPLESVRSGRNAYLEKLK